MILNIVSALAGPIGTLAERYFDNKDDQEKFKNAVELEILKNGKAVEDAASNIVLAEANSEHSITAMWRPILMLVIIAIVAIHHLIFPLVNLFFATDLIIELPSELWNLLTVGVGGYVVGRSGEKMMKVYKETE